MSLLSESGQLAKLTRTLQFPRSAAAHYWLAVVAVAALLLLRLGLGPLLHGHGAFLLFIPAILLAAGLGGLGPGLLATALSLVLAGIFVGGDRDPDHTRDSSRSRFLPPSASASPGSASSFTALASTIGRPPATSAPARRISIDPRYRARRDGRHRRARAHPVVQLGRRAAVRLRTPMKSSDRM